ncbi:MAG: S24/S26 family peptidase, partial [Tannerella sp.]|nr:S24/S26 family peptidase [Tannerella sp.]
MRTVTLPDKTFMSEVAALLAGGKQVTLKVKGNSMLPFIVGGLDSVVLQKQESYRRGDVVLAEVGQSRFVLHRIIRIDGNVVVLMGDGNLTGT